MATFVITDVYLSIGGVDLSDHGTTVNLTYEAEAQDDTAFGDTTRSNAGGLKVWSMDGECHQDYAASKVDATLFPLVGSTTTCTVRSVSTGGVSATNPNFTGLGLVQTYSPLTGAVGDQAKAPFTILAAGTLSRATS